ncbi:MAG: 2OG-Fe(II) oxygenase [Myxococcota bacterium]
MQIEHLVPEYIVLVRDFLSAERCRERIAWSEAEGYEEARLSDGSRRTDVRNNDRLIFDDAALASRWWARVREAVPVLPSAHPIGLNERFRFYRYHPGQQFRHHRDGVFQRNDSELSQFTLLVYLNADFEGGGTTFGRWSVTPETGMALLFRHEIEHAGEAVLRGCKYVLRTDVMFRRGKIS